jgi:hypothetical protein
MFGFHSGIEQKSDCGFPCRNVESRIDCCIHPQFPRPTSSSDGVGFNGVLVCVTGELQAEHSGIWGKAEAPAWCLVRVLNTSNKRASYTICAYSFHRTWYD